MLANNCSKWVCMCNVYVDTYTLYTFTIGWSLHRYYSTAVDMKCMRIRRISGLLSK